MGGNVSAKVREHHYVKFFHGAFFCFFIWASIGLDLVEPILWYGNQSIDIICSSISNTDCPGIVVLQLLVTTCTHSHVLHEIVHLYKYQMQSQEMGTNQKNTWKCGQRGDELIQILTICALFDPGTTGKHCLKSPARMIILPPKGSSGLSIRSRSVLSRASS